MLRVIVSDDEKFGGILTTVKRRSVVIIGSVLIGAVLVVRLGNDRTDLQGSLLDTKQIARNVKVRADIDGNGILTARELRKTLAVVIGGVALGRQSEDVNGDRVVNRGDIRVTTQAIRRLLIASCANGVVDIDEDCDDRNTVNGDGCSATCILEPRYRCTGEPSTCIPLTGDEYVAVRLETSPSGTANAGDTIPLMRFSVEAFPGVTPVPVTASISVTTNRGVINDLVSVTAYQDTDGDGQYETQVGDPVTAQSVLGSNFFAMPLPVGSAGSARHIELRGRLTSRVIVREISLKFPDPRLQPDSVHTASVSFDGAAPDQVEASLNGSCRLTTQICPVSITTTDGTAGYYTITNPPCGNGTLNQGETCDDGNTDAGDGCDNSCHTETRYTCTGTPSVCVHDCGNGVCAADETSLQLPAHEGAPYFCEQDCGTCGDGVIKSAEVCDDGNAANSDGCSLLCEIESGFRCSGSPSVCTDVMVMETLTAKLPVPLKDFGLAWDQVDRKAYIFGGETRNGNYVLHPRNVIEFDAATQTFTTKTAQVPEGGLWNTSAIWDPVHRKAYVFGGYTERTLVGQDPILMSAAIYVYDPEADTFSVARTMPTVRFWVTPVFDTQRNVIYAIGGTRGYARPPNQEPYSDVVSQIVRFDPETLQITTIPFPHSELGTIKDPAVYDPDTDKVYIFGYHGQAYTNNQGVLVHELDPAAGTVILHQDVSLPAEVNKGVYLGFHAFWDPHDHAIRLVGGAMYNTFYEPGASRFNDTYNYTFSPIGNTFTRWKNSPTGNKLEETRRGGGFFYDETEDAFTVMGGIPNAFEWNLETDTVQKFAF